MNHVYSYSPLAESLLRYALTLSHRLHSPALRPLSSESDYWRALAAVLVTHPESKPARFITQYGLAEHQQQALLHYDKLWPQISSINNVGSNSPGYLEQYAADTLKPSNFPLTRHITVAHLWWLTYYHSRLFFPDELRLPDYELRTMEHAVDVPLGLRPIRLAVEWADQPAPQVAPIRYRRRLY